MDGWVWAVIIAAAVIVIVAVAWAGARQRRRQQTLTRFGPEYDRAVAEHGDDRKAAERDLMDRARRRDEFELRDLTPEARVRYRQEWQAIQARFVDAPEESIGSADRLLDQVMRERGYPLDVNGDFDDKAGLVSVDHPDVVQDYRAARAVQQRNAQRLASTDELRQAILRYRALFEALLGADQIDLDRNGSTAPRTTSPTSDRTTETTNQEVRR